MKRKEMLDKLQTIEGVMVGDLVMTYDIGLQYAYATKDGFGFDYGCHVGRWPVIRIKDRTLSNKWQTILGKIKDGSLCYDDLKDTRLETIANRVNQGYSLSPGKDPETNKVNMAEYMKPLLAIPQKVSSDFFVFLDLGRWELDDLEVYPTPEEAERAFLEEYCYINNWEKLDDDELEEWYEKIFSEYSEYERLGDFLNSYDDEEEDNLE